MKKFDKINTMENKVNKVKKSLTNGEKSVKINTMENKVNKVKKSLTNGEKSVKINTMENKVNKVKKSLTNGEKSVKINTMENKVKKIEFMQARAESKICKSMENLFNLFGEIKKDILINKELKDQELLLKFYKFTRKINFGGGNIVFSSQTLKNVKSFFNYVKKDFKIKRGKRILKIFQEITIFLMWFEFLYAHHRKIREINQEDYNLITVLEEKTRLER